LNCNFNLSASGCILSVCSLIVLGSFSIVLASSETAGEPASLVKRSSFEKHLIKQLICVIYEWIAEVKQVKLVFLASST